MKILILSDTHGNFLAVKRVLIAQDDADMVIHLGDGEGEMNAMLRMFPELPEKLHYICGNCDSGVVVPGTKQEDIIDLPYGHRILAAHGHSYLRRGSFDYMLEDARRLGCDIVLYGHTHYRHNTYQDGLYIINPGSLTLPRDGKPPCYAVISISEKGILASHVDLLV